MSRKSVIAYKIDESREILKSLGLPPAQQNDISALTLLSLCCIKPKDPWTIAKRQSLTVSKGIMDFIASEYKVKYAPNTRETVRRQVLHQFVQANLVDYNPDNPALPTNSPKAHYAITNSALDLIKTFKTKYWPKSLKEYINHFGKLEERYRKDRDRKMIPLVLSDGKKLVLSPGKHNEVQKAVAQEFAPRFAPGSKILYFGDTANKTLHVDKDEFANLNVTITEHDKLPDIVLYDNKRKWLFLIEVVTSHGPMSPKRIVELNEIFKKCKVGKVFVTAFPNFAEFKKHIPEIAWETEVWVADNPDHMIHFNGDKFFGPR